MVKETKQSKKENEMTIQTVYYQDAQNPDKSEDFDTIEEARIKAEKLAANNQSSTIWVNEEPIEFWIYNYFTGKMEIDTI